MTAPRSRRNKGAKRSRPATPNEVTEEERAQMASRLHNRGELAGSRIRWARAHPDRAAEVGVTFPDETKRYEYEVVEIVPGEDRTKRYDIVRDGPGWAIGIHPRRAEPED